MERIDLANLLVSGIVVVRIGSKYIQIIPASARHKTLADFFAQECYEECLLCGLWSTHDSIQLSIDRGIVTREEIDSINGIEETIEQMKVDYFKNFHEHSRKANIKRAINGESKKIADISSRRDSFIDTTAEYLKSYAYTQYLVEHNSLFLDGSCINDECSFQMISRAYMNAVQDISSRLRSLAKSTEWRVLWQCLKEGMFENKPSSFTGFQTSVISWSHYYDGINQSANRPSEAVVQDDIAMDGWSINERIKREEEDKKRQSESLLPSKMSKAGEILIPATTREQIKNVYEMNDSRGKAKLKSLGRDLSSNGVLEDSQLTFNRREIQMESNRINNRRM